MKQPESIILAFSNVMNDSLKHLNPELQKIRNVLKDAEEEKLLNIIEHNGVTYNSLSFLLHSVKGKDATILHYSGHSSKAGLLVQSHDETGVVSKKPLSNLVRAHKKFRLVFLNSCYSRDIAQEMISAGVPYVIGTSDRVNDAVAAVVAAKFYSLLAKSGKTIEESFLLTKDYIDDPMNNDDADHKEAFRTFQVFDDSKNDYPWHLYESAEIRDKDKNWVLVPKKVSWKLYLAGVLGSIILLLAVFNRDKFLSTEKPVNSFAADSSSKVVIKASDTFVKSDTQNNNKNPVPPVSLTSLTNNPSEKAASGKRLPATREVALSKEVLSKLASLNGTSFGQLSSTDNLSFTVGAKNMLSFSGKLAGYLVSGKLKLINNMNFQVTEGDISGNLNFINNEENISGNVTIKESQLSHTLNLERTKD